jgi:hypothetical protein
MKNLNIYNCYCVILLFIALSGCTNMPRKYTESSLKPEIFPDYDSVTIPPNISPLNFSISEKADEYRVEICAQKGEKINIQQRSGDIRIPIKKWRNLLAENTGKDLTVDVYIRKNGNWTRYKPLVMTVAQDPIDPYLVYRKLGNPNAYTFWKSIGIYQRDLESYDEDPLYRNLSANNNCVNCHSFCKGDPKKMSMHFRVDQGGTMILNEGKLQRLNTKTPQTMSNFVYPSWHPGGRFIAYSTNIILLNFSAGSNIVSELSDKASDIVLYDLERNIVTTSPKISTQSRENLPSWSPDGKYMYFISSALTDINNVQDRILGKYSLLRIAFDPETVSWGEIDTLISADKTGFSVSMPIPSPDGKFLLFCRMDHGYFSVFDHNSDIYLYDIQTGRYRRMDINTSSNESYHGWSQNGRWIVFSSKRVDNIYSATHFAYFDKEGREHKPFILPQEDPEYYKTCMKNFNRPELITGKIDLSETDIRDLIYSPAGDVVFDSAVDINALSGATWIKSHK